MNLETIRFKNNRLVILDQTLLPNRKEFVTLADLQMVVEAIRSLKVRGAPAIGIVAAYGLVVHAQNLARKGKLTVQALTEAGALLKKSRPTAVNLAWAVNRLLDRVADLKESEAILTSLSEEALAIHDEDRQMCEAIGSFGNQLVPEKATILTHCNTGFLATGGIGTALGVVYKAWQNGKKIEVFVDETRPVGQGARLTYWELQENGVPATLITDSMAGLLMREGKVDLVITGADRIAANGDSANKIGTYSLAVLAHHHQIPFYIAAPFSSFDLALKSGEEIPIEERPKAEVLNCWNFTHPEKYRVFNPAFDVTPHSLISAIITEKGIIEKPNFEKINKLYQTFN
jgi:methylthioribose-1-phosphate isomerase